MIKRPFYVIEGNEKDFTSCALCGTLHTPRIELTDYFNDDEIVYLCLDCVCLLGSLDIAKLKRLASILQMKEALRRQDSIVEDLETWKDTRLVMREYPTGHFDFYITFTKKEEK